MINKLLAAEFMKIKRKGLWLLTLIAPIGVVGLQMVNYGVRKEYLLQQSENDWEYYIQNVSYMTASGLILGIVILTSLLSSIEKETNAMKQWLTLPIARSKIYLSKFLAVGILLLLASFILAIVTLCYGISLDFGESIPFISIIKYSFYPYLASLAILALHMWISTVSLNQGLSLTIGILGTITSIVAFNLPDWFIWKWPLLQNDWNNPLISVAFSLITTVILFFSGMIHYSRKDVA